MGSSKKKELENRGYLLLKKWHPGLSTLETAKMLGIIIDVERIASNHKISTVQTLTPHNSHHGKSNTYSETFGLTEFPLHSDYAHWQMPPRYLMLRCLEGSKMVETYLLSTSHLLNAGVDYIDRAVVTPRRKHPTQIICTLPVLFSNLNTIGLRWDFLFLKPVNSAAAKVGELVKSYLNRSSHSIQLSEPYDTLILDNWKMLHGRSSVPPQAMNRKIERIYLSDIW